MPAVTPSPLPESKYSVLDHLLDGLDAPALHWLSGYVAGVAAEREGKRALPLAAPVAAAARRRRITVVYGSQTGNAKRIAESLAAQFEAANLPVRLLRADAYPQRELKDETLLYIVMSTQGEGDPPDDSMGFVEFVSGKRAPKLPGLQYAVLGLGDTSYPEFCGISRKLDERLNELGAKRLQEAGAADLDIETVARPWTVVALERAREVFAERALPLASVTPLRRADAGALDAAATAAAFHREAPFLAEVLENQRITARDSDKDIRHVEFSLEGSGLTYEPGDALGVWPRQPSAQVEEVLELLNLAPDVVVEHDSTRLPLSEWLGKKRELTRLARPFLAEHAKRNGDAALAHALTPEGRDQLAALFDRYQLPDLLRAYPASWTADELVARLRPLAPRMYSIASSREEVGNEVHLTVANVRYRSFERDRVGVASRYLSHLDDDARAPIFIEPNDRFRLPADPARDIVMIGPGTGIAPFRAFVQHRASTGATGRNWLFFGNPHFTADFLYQVEWQKALADGSLNRIDLAFSRDQQKKIYVQHRMLEQGKDLYSWIEGGGHVYVCGDANHMAKDVHNALLDIAVAHGGKSREVAQTWLADLARNGRYARDVY
jgi:sulfite reductase (NADPH) flavoprotein alpha-component